jgi:hypothetical protein
MIRAGWATVYEQANAEYGKEGKEHYLTVEATAKYVPLLLSRAPFSVLLVLIWI